MYVVFAANVLLNLFLLYQNYLLVLKLILIFMQSKLDFFQELLIEYTYSSQMMFDIALQLLGTGISSDAGPCAGWYPALLHQAAIPLTSKLQLRHDLQESWPCSSDRVPESYHSRQCLPKHSSPDSKILEFRRGAPCTTLSWKYVLYEDMNMSMF